MSFLARFPSGLKDHIVEEPVKEHAAYDSHALAALEPVKENAAPAGLEPVKEEAPAPAPAPSQSTIKPIEQAKPKEQSNPSSSSTSKPKKLGPSERRIDTENLVLQLQEELHSEMRERRKDKKKIAELETLIHSSTDKQKIAELEALIHASTDKSKILQMEERLSDNAVQMARLRRSLEEQDERVQAWVASMREAIEVKSADIYSKVVTIRQTMLGEVNKIFDLVSTLDLIGYDEASAIGRDGTPREGNSQASTSKLQELQQRYHDRVEKEMQKVKLEIQEAAEGRQKAALFNLGSDMNRGDIEGKDTNAVSPEQATSEGDAEIARRRGEDQSS